ncbi:MAG: calcium-binding protein [Geminicoccaceae bacterium]
MLFTTNGTFSAAGRISNSETGEIVSIADKRGSSSIFTATGADTTLQGDTHATIKADAIVYDLTLGSMNALRFSGFTRFELGTGDDVLDLAVRAANASSAYTLDVTALGGTGNDVLWTGGGADLVYGDAVDLVNVVAGADRLHGGDGDDVLYGDSDTMDRTGSNTARFGDDNLAGGDGNDTLYGDGDALAEGITFGDDVLDGGDGDDFLYGDYFSQTYEGGGNDRLSGGAGADLLRGGAGDDILNGGADKDNLYGGAGKDVLNGGTHNDRLFGGTESDTFIAQAGMGRDIILDFDDTVGTGDKIDVSALGIRSFAALSITGNGTATAIVTFSGSDSFEVRHDTMTAFTLGAGDFIFAP